MDECITRLPQAKVDTSEAESLDWQKRLETVPKRLAEMLPGEDILFASDMRRWHHRLQYYKQVSFCFLASKELVPLHVFTAPVSQVNHRNVWSKDFNRFVTVFQSITHTH